MSTVPPLRIALIAACEHPVAEPFAGGLEAHVWTLARELVDRGHRVSLFAAPGSDVSLGAELMTIVPLDLDPLARADASMPAGPWLRAHHAYLGLMLELAARGTDAFDVVHNHSLHHLPVAMAPSLTVPMLTTLHTPPTPWLQSAMAVAGGGAGRLVAVSEHTARTWRAIAPEVGVLLNGVDVDRWVPGPGGERLVWSGRLTPEKAPHLAVLAARRAGFAIDLAGPISNPAYVDAEVRPLLDDRAVYRGHLRQPELAALVGSSAAALVTPAWDEPFGLVVAEALACGTPVAAFDRGGVAEVVDASSGVLVRPGDVDELAKAVVDAVALSRLDARARATTHLSVGSMVDAHEALYATMAAA